MKRVRRLAQVCGVLSLVPLVSTDLPAQGLPVYGGSAGMPFSRACYPWMVMTGIRFRAGAVLNAVGLLCRPVPVNGTLGSEYSVETLVGGGGGTLQTRSCPDNMVVVGAEIEYGDLVSQLTLICRTWNAAKRGHGLPEEFAEPAGSFHPTKARNAERCPAPTPAKGIRGRSGCSGCSGTGPWDQIDAIGISCGKVT